MGRALAWQHSAAQAGPLVGSSLPAFIRSTTSLCDGAIPKPLKARLPFSVLCSPCGRAWMWPRHQAAAARTIGPRKQVCGPGFQAWLCSVGMLMQVPHTTLAGSQAPGCCMHTSALQQQQGSGEREQGASSTSSAPCTGGQAGAPHSTLQAMHMLPPTSGRAPLGLGSALHGPSQLPCPLLGGASSGSSASPSSASSSQSSSASRELGSAQRGFFSLPNPQEFK